MNNLVVNGSIVKNDGLFQVFKILSIENEGYEN